MRVVNAITKVFIIQTSAVEIKTTFYFIERDAMDVIYALIQLGIDYSDRDKIESYHHSIDGAKASIPNVGDRMEVKIPRVYENDGKTVAYFLYYKIERIEVLP